MMDAENLAPEPEAEVAEPVRLERPVMAEQCAGCGRLMVPSRATLRIDEDRKPVCCPCTCSTRWREWRSK